MKIHIVQKGDTLWKIANQYGVNFEELKQANSQLTNPDMMMPGTKIKVPTNAVQAKKTAPKKEIPQQVSPTETPKTEMPVSPVEQPKKEMPVQLDENKVKSMIQNIVSQQLPGIVQGMMQQLKPEIMHQIIVELEYSKKEEKVEKKVPYEQVKPMPHKPIQHKPIQPKPMPKPYQPQKVKGMEHPCPPYPPSMQPMGYSPTQTGPMAGYQPKKGKQMPDIPGPMSQPMSQHTSPYNTFGVSDVQQPYAPDTGMPQHEMYGSQGMPWATMPGYGPGQQQQGGAGLGGPYGPQGPYGSQGPYGPQGQKGCGCGPKTTPSMYRDGTDQPDKPEEQHEQQDERGQKDE